MRELQESVDKLREEIREETGMDPVEHCLARIKSEESMREKCRRKMLPEDTEAALTQIYDAVGLRVVCAFIDDIYRIRDHLVQQPGTEVVEEKDYIRNVKPNGYRSYHMILRIHGKFYAEVQLRTISMDTWAALEHHLRYKKQLGGNTSLIESELKRCADELASTDLSMQTIRDMILEYKTEE
jgi:ppGpp synthetase/RelA/SpoT-type nucleotidyltranferase